MNRVPEIGSRPVGERNCPLCGEPNSRVILDRPEVPTLLNRFLPSPSEARSAPVGHLQIASCEGCGFVFNRRFDPELVAYDEHYENDQSCSPRFSQHLGAMQERISESLAGAQATILEVGCGQGHFLESLIARIPAASRVVGYDTAWRCRRLPEPMRVAAAHFDRPAAEAEGRVYDIAVARHVIEHVADPVAFLRALRIALKPGGRVFIETPALEWIIAKNQMQDFFYEHCNYFTEGSLRSAFRLAGFGRVSIEVVFCGQYMWAEARIGGDATCRALATKEAPALDREFFTRWRLRLAGLKSRGEIAVWGAGAKGVTFVTEADPSGDLVSLLIDASPKKQGWYIPKSGHLIVNPEQAKNNAIATVIVMNPTYQSEVQQMAQAAGLDVSILAA